MVKLAGIPPLVVEPKAGSTVVQFSTGSYRVVMCDLLRYWGERLGKTIDPIYTDGLRVLVTGLTPTTEMSGLTVQYTITMDVDGELVTITVYITRTKLQVQGGQGAKEFTRRALIPFLEDEVIRCAEEIQKVNLSYDSVMASKTPDRRKTLRTTYTCNDCCKIFRTVLSLNLHIKNAHRDTVANLAKPKTSIRSKKIAKLNAKKAMVFQEKQPSGSSSLMEELVEELVEEVASRTPSPHHSPAPSSATPPPLTRLARHSPDTELSLRLSMLVFHQSPCGDC